MQKRLTALFSGTVQGVGFRYTTERLSRQFQVTGYVKNLKDGRVEMIAEGDEKEIMDFLTAIRGSSLAHYIQNLQTVWENPSGSYQIFEIAH